MPGLNPQRSGKGVRSENASRNAYVMRRNVYDLHRKFGSEMATKSSRKIDGENPSLSGISHAARAFSFTARRGGVRDLRSRCAPLQAPFPLAAGALANYLKLTALRPLSFFRTSPYRSKLLTAWHEKSPALCAELQIVCGEGGSEELPI